MKILLLAAILIAYAMLIALAGGLTKFNQLDY